MYRVWITLLGLAVVGGAAAAAEADLERLTVVLLALAAWGAAGVLALLLWARGGQARAPRGGPPPVAPVAPAVPTVSHPLTVQVHWVHEGQITPLPAELLAPPRLPR